MKKTLIERFLEEDRRHLKTINFQGKGFVYGTITQKVKEFTREKTKIFHPNEDFLKKNGQGDDTADIYPIIGKVQNVQFFDLLIWDENAQKYYNNIPLSKDEAGLHVNKEFFKDILREYGGVKDGEIIYGVPSIITIESYSINTVLGKWSDWISNTGQIDDYIAQSI